MLQHSEPALSNPGDFFLSKTYPQLVYCNTVYIAIPAL